MAALWRLTKAEREERDAYLRRFRKHSFTAVVLWYEEIVPQEQKTRALVDAYSAWWRHWKGGRGAIPKALKES
jgi:hypothetical protein